MHHEKTATTECAPREQSQLQFFGFASGLKIPLQKAYYEESTESGKKLEVLMRTICYNFSFFFTPKNILVIHLSVGHLSAWSFPRLVLLFQNLRSGEPTHRRLAHWKPFQEMMWWRYLLQLWLSLVLVKFALEASLIRQSSFIFFGFTLCVLHF